MARPLWGKRKVKNEIERRFLIRWLPEIIATCEMATIMQGYLEDKRRTRYRKELFDRLIVYVKAWKIGFGVERLECEQEICRATFLKRWQQVSCSLRKKRYFVPYGEHVIEVNIFLDALDGYVHAEVEFSTREAADAFVAPDWFDREVTDDERHGNYWLAKYGIPKEAA